MSSLVVLIWGVTFPAGGINIFLYCSVDLNRVNPIIFLLF